MPLEQSLEDKLNQLRVLAFDVDGVLTDGGVWWGADGQEWKRFGFADIMGLSLARRAGYEIALISGEDSPLVDRLALKLRIKHVSKGCRDKAAALRDLSTSTGMALTYICFMGDDVNDLPAMQIAGVSAANAVPAVLARVDFVARSAGGNGAVREFIDATFAARGLSASAIYAEAIEKKDR
jgi:3-deoxy-D-manno-octulosonate 8-phosphate phosphatase (KDO 8-P phosphatase)